MAQYVDVLLPLPLANHFTYLLPQEFNGQVQIGSRVLVSFGRRKFYSAVVRSVHGISPTAYQPKEVTEVLDGTPILTRTQLMFWEWISSYYLCSLGEVYKAAMPSALKLESETVVLLNDGVENLSELLPHEQEVVAVLEGEKGLSLERLLKLLPGKGVMRVVNKLLDNHVLVLSEEVKRPYRPRQEVCVRLLVAQGDEERMKQLFEQLGRARKQMELVMAYLDLSRFMHRGRQVEVTRKALLEKSGASAAILTALVDKGLFELYRREVSELQFAGSSVQPVKPLTHPQQTAFDALIDGFTHHNVMLLHGITSSGKTEIYIHLIEEVLKKQKQILYLVPEIALTTQLTERLRSVFGSRLGVYHSKYSDRERVEVWNDLLTNRTYRVILGVRSSVFLPFKELGLVIVDEEHEPSYKQQDPAPRYHARNAAIVLASKYGAKTVLGTATPSLESYHNAEIGKYGLVELTTRYADMQLPHIEVIDTKELKRKKLMDGLFSPPLVEQMTRALERKEQIILFQNRRGFAPLMECKMCDWVPRCNHCDVSLTYHKGINRLTCHYCGTDYPVPRQCPVCGSVAIPTRGFGTEQVEEEVGLLFPQAKVARMDLDTTRTRKAYAQLIHAFETGKVDILIGTQMVTKGLDFDRVSIVVVLSADTLLNFPDFRAHERAFQLMAQVAGRAGRKHKRGTVLLQTSSPGHPVIEQVVNNDYGQMYNTQMAERTQFRYPPLYRLIYLYMKHRDEALLNHLSVAVAHKLTELFGVERVLGPDKPMVGRVQTLYIKKVVLKVESGASIEQVRQLLHRMREEMLDDPRFKSLLMYYDVDPL